MASMQKFRVRWETEVEATSPDDAAVKAMWLHKEGDDAAFVYEVKRISPPGKTTYTIDFYSGNVVEERVSRRG